MTLVVVSPQTRKMAEFVGELKRKIPLLRNKTADGDPAREHDSAQRPNTRTLRDEMRKMETSQISWWHFANSIMILMNERCSRKMTLFMVGNPTWLMWYHEDPLQKRTVPILLNPTNYHQSICIGEMSWFQHRDSKICNTFQYVSFRFSYFNHHWNVYSLSKWLI